MSLFDRLSIVDCNPLAAWVTAYAALHFLHVFTIADVCMGFPYHLVANLLSISGSSSSDYTVYHTTLPYKQ